MPSVAPDSECSGGGARGLGPGAGVHARSFTTADKPRQHESFVRGVSAGTPRCEAMCPRTYGTWHCGVSCPRSPPGCSGERACKHAQGGCSEARPGRVLGHRHQLSLRSLSLHRRPTLRRATTSGGGRGAGAARQSLRSYQPSIAAAVGSGGSQAQGSRLNLGSAVPGLDPSSAASLMADRIKLMGLNTAPPRLTKR